MRKILTEEYYKEQKRLWDEMNTRANKLRKEKDYKTASVLTNSQKGLGKNPELPNEMAALLFIQLAHIAVTR